MIHVNVKHSTRESGFAVEVSVDGAKWVEHWFLPARGANEVEQRLAAESDARMYAAGIKFGGGDVRMTAFGESVYVPDMTTVRV